jgi:tetratricopeptide (TPR) repeat protein
MMFNLSGSARPVRDGLLRYQNRVFRNRPNGQVSGGGGGPKDFVDFNLTEARRVIGEGRINDALSYLEPISGKYISLGNIEAAIALLDEARETIEGSNNNASVFWVFRVAERNHEIGRQTERDFLLSYALARIKVAEEQYQRDEIRSAAVMTYLHIENMEEAVRIAVETEDPICKFSNFREIAKAFIKNSQNKAAADFILSQGLEVARSQPERSAKVEHLIIFAELLISIKMNEDAISFLTEAAGHLSNLDTLDDRQMEMVTLNLARLGRRGQVIELIARGWINEDHPQLTPERVAEMKLDVVKRRFPKVHALISKE